MSVFEEYSLEDWAGLPQTKFADMPSSWRAGRPERLVELFNLPNRLWGLLGPQRTKIVHIFVIG